MLHALVKTTVFCATALAAGLPLLATADDAELVFFCPPSIMAAVGQSTGIMCDAERCFKAESPELNSKQKAFLVAASGQCRYFTALEVADYWPKEATQQARK
jgi:fructose-specific component phosphotransferase system IIB-like protein